MTERLDGSNQTVDKVIETYQEGTTGCIKKIGRRLNTEHDTLSKQWDADSGRFRQSVDKSKEAIRGHSTERNRAIPRLQQESGERQMTYDRASSSLRAFQRHVTSGRGLGGRRVQ